LKTNQTTNEQQFIELIEQNKSRILRICKVYAWTPQDQEDLFQEISFQIWRSLPKFKQASSIHTWLYRIALNVSMRYQQKQLKKKKEVSGKQDTVLAFAPSNEADAGTQMIQQERIDQLYACIGKLKKVDRSVILLHLEELSYDEIAEITGLTKTNVGVKIGRIKKNLLKQMS